MTATVVGPFTPCATSAPSANFLTVAIVLLLYETFFRLSERVFPAVIKTDHVLQEPDERVSRQVKNTYHVVRRTAVDSVSRHKNLPRAREMTTVFLAIKE